MVFMIIYRKFNTDHQERSPHYQNSHGLFYCKHCIKYDQLNKKETSEGFALGFFANTHVVQQII